MVEKRNRILHGNVAFFNLQSIDLYVCLLYDLPFICNTTLPISIQDSKSDVNVSTIAPRLLPVAYCKPIPNGLCLNSTVYSIGSFSVLEYSRYLCV